MKFDQVSKKVSFESMLTSTAIGQPLAEMQVGLVADTSDPRPAFRLKLSGMDKLMGRLPPGTLWVAEKLEITVDVRPNLADGAGQSIAAGVLPALPQQGSEAQGILPALPPSGGAAATEGPPPSWTTSGWAPLFAALIAAGVLATNALTWGMRMSLTGTSGLMLPGSPRPEA